MNIALAKQVGKFDAVPGRTQVERQKCQRPQGSEVPITVSAPTIKSRMTMNKT